LKRSTLPFCQGQLGADELLGDAVAVANVAQRVSVGPGVVGDQPFDAGDAEVSERRDRAFEECGAGRTLLVGRHLGVGEAGVIVDDRMDVVEPDARLVDSGLMVRNELASSAPAAAIGNPAELLHVHVDQLARPVVFVADRRPSRRRDHRPGERIAIRQTRHVVTAQDRRDRPRWHAHHVSEAVLPDPQRSTSNEHPLLDGRRRLRR